MNTNSFGTLAQSLYSDFEIGKVYYMLYYKYIGTSIPIYKVRLDQITISKGTITILVSDINTGQIFRVRNCYGTWRPENNSNDHVEFESKSKSDRLKMLLGNSDDKYYQNVKLMYTSEDFTELLKSIKSDYLKCDEDGNYSLTCYVVNGAQVRELKIDWKVIIDKDGLHLYITPGYTKKNGFYPTKLQAHNQLIKLFENTSLKLPGSEIKSMDFFNYWNTNFGFLKKPINWDKYESNKGLEYNAINQIKLIESK